MKLFLVFSCFGNNWNNVKIQSWSLYFGVVINLVHSSYILVVFFFDHCYFFAAILVSIVNSLTKLEYKLKITWPIGYYQNIWTKLTITPKYRNQNYIFVKNIRRQKQFFFFFFFWWEDKSNFNNTCNQEYKDVWEFKLVQIIKCF